MHPFLKSLFPLTASVVILLWGSMPAVGELIEPTRTLDGKGRQVGYLSVFSEPPKMAVYLDGKQIGATPLSAHVVSAGKHLLRVGDVEKELFVLPGKALRYSIHKGRLIRLPEKKKKPLQTREQDGKLPVEIKIPADDTHEDEDIPPPQYFPQNPKGPIY